jgi:hypothetical protein
LVKVGRKKIKDKKMKGLFWNIRSLGQKGRTQALASRIRENHIDFVGVSEIKKGEYSWHAEGSYG